MGTPLDPTVLKNRQLSVVIYWSPITGPDALQSGHAALIIDTRSFSLTSLDYYVSWMGGGGANALKQPAAAQNFNADMMTWGGKATKTGGHVPTRWVALKNLKTDLMKAEWDKIHAKVNGHWKLLDKNCATIAARVLKAGGSDNYAKAAREQLVWWPTDLITYAKSMGSVVVSTS